MPDKLGTLTSLRRAREIRPALAHDAAKANFDRAYCQPDPRRYFRELCDRLGYVIPELASPVFSTVATRLEKVRGRPLRVLDLGCSYGINAALLQFPIDLDRLTRRYVTLPEGTISPGQLAKLDRNYFLSWPRRPMDVLGLDASAPAIEYARSTGILRDGIVGNFETDVLPPEAHRLLRGVDLVISTGAVGYITEKTIEKVLAAIGEPAPWVAAFVLRMFPYTDVSAALAAAGLVTEKLANATFIQRCFASEAESHSVEERLHELGIDPAGKESEGHLHAEFFLSRPASEASACPLSELICLTQGPTDIAINRPAASAGGRNLALHRPLAVAAPP